MNGWDKRKEMEIFMPFSNLIRTSNGGSRQDEMQCAMERDSLFFVNNFYKEICTSYALCECIEDEIEG